MVVKTKRYEKLRDEMTMRRETDGNDNGIIEITSSVWLIEYVEYLKK